VRADVLMRVVCICVRLVSELVLYCIFQAGREAEKKSILIHVRVVSERENLSVFCSREKKRRISPCCRGEKDNHLIQRIGETREEEGDKHRCQKWKGRYVISERD
jgi:hypothetical protein